jgi:ubiquitin C-terminal hydrolase
MAEYTKDKETKGTKYALRAYICHTGDTVTGSCISRFYHRSNGKWYNCHDGTVDEMLAEDHFVAEAYLLFYERCL